MFLAELHVDRCLQPGGKKEGGTNDVQLSKPKPKVSSPTSSMLLSLNSGTPGTARPSGGAKLRKSLGPDRRKLPSVAVDHFDAATANLGLVLNGMVTDEEELASHRKAVQLPERDLRRGYAVQSAMDVQAADGAVQPEDDGLALQRTGDGTGAGTAGSEAVRLGGTRPLLALRYHWALGCLHEHRGRCAEAVAHFQQCLDLCHTPEDPRRSLGEATGDAVSQQLQARAAEGSAAPTLRQKKRPAPHSVDDIVPAKLRKAGEHGRASAGPMDAEAPESAGGGPHEEASVGPMVAEAPESAGRGPHEEASAGPMDAEAPESAPAVGGPHAGAATEPIDAEAPESAPPVGGPHDGAPADSMDAEAPGSAPPVRSPHEGAPAEPMDAEAPGSAPPAGGPHEGAAAEPMDAETPESAPAEGDPHEGARDRPDGAAGTDQAEAWSGPRAATAGAGEHAGVEVRLANCRETPLISARSVQAKLEGLEVLKLLDSARALMEAGRAPEVVVRLKPAVGMGEANDGFAGVLRSARAYPKALSLLQVGTGLLCVRMGANVAGMMWGVCRIKAGM